MRISITYLTLIITTICATIGLAIAYFTDWIILIPAFFGLGIPLVNIDKPFKQKLGLTMVNVVASTAIFIATVVALINVDFDLYVAPGIIVGLAGVGILVVHGLLIETVRLDLKTIPFAFFLSGLSLPVWIWLTEDVFTKISLDSAFVRQFGGILFWMILTTIGICVSIKPEPKNRTDRLP